MFQGALKNFDTGGSLRSLVKTYKQLVLRSESFVHRLLDLVVEICLKQALRKTRLI